MNSSSAFATADSVLAAGVRFHCENNSAIAVELESDHSVVFSSHLAIARGFVVPVKLIESEAYLRSSFKSFVIPRCATFIEESTLQGSKISSILIESGNSTVSVDDLFLSKDSRTTLVRYFGFFSEMVIPRCVETLGSKSFDLCQSLSSISFESDSQLKSIESKAFYKYLLKSIGIPCCFATLSSKCFDFYPSLSSISFKSDSQLNCIESGAFHGTLIPSVQIPLRVSFIAGDELSARCELFLSGDCCPKPCVWDSFRRRGSRSDFHRP
jgi:hypothetical protein